MIVFKLNKLFLQNCQTKIQFEGLLTLHVILQRVSHTIEYCKNFGSLSSHAEFSMNLQQATRKVNKTIKSFLLVDYFALQSQKAVSAYL